MIEVIHNETTWAQKTFGSANLGDARLNQRLIKIADQAARQPHVLLTKVFKDTNHLAASYAFVENDRIAPAEILRAIGSASAKEAAQYPVVYVATDGSSVSITDRSRSKQTGRIGSSNYAGRGDKVHTALLMDPSGIPIGISDMQFWRRTGKPRNKKHASLKTEEKETQRWLDARCSVRTQLAQYAPGTRPVFLHDREADAWPILLDAIKHRDTEDTIIRANWNRRVIPVDVEKQDERVLLRDQLATTAVCGTYVLSVHGGPNRTARLATMNVRSALLTLALPNKKVGTPSDVRFHVVQATEVSAVPDGQKAIEWLLYTTREITSFEDAMIVVDAYRARWRIEEFHRAWKSGGTDVERIQIHSANGREKWLFILAAIACRSVRLAYLNKHPNDADPHQEFSDEEIAMVSAVEKNGRKAATGAITINRMIHQIAILGGYVPQKCNPYPGPQTIIRGLFCLADMLHGSQITQRETA